jgi:FdhE protein
MDLTFWDKQINRATELAGHSAANELLTFYTSVLSAQRDIYTTLATTASQSSNDLASDMKLLSDCMPVLFKSVEETGSPQLNNEMQFLKTSESTDIVNMLEDYSNNRSPTEFFTKALFQPYGRWCWENDLKRFGPKIPVAERNCPACGGVAQVSALFESDSRDGGSRHLLCATCLFQWSYRRVACAYCGEEAPAKLSYFKADQFEHIRIEVCETCRRYVKSIDLTQLGTACPLVDDVASASLDLWAAERGYTKVEINLVGL